MTGGSQITIATNEPPTPVLAPYYEDPEFKYNPSLGESFQLPVDKTKYEKINQKPVIKRLASYTDMH